MKKGMLLTALALVCLMILSACSCSHRNWLEADCENPKHCESCNATEGEALGHSWTGSCDEPRTCEICGATEAEALGHAWVEADGDTPAHCSNCGLMQVEMHVSRPVAVPNPPTEFYGQWVSLTPSLTLEFAEGGSLTVTGAAEFSGVYGVKGGKLHIATDWDSTQSISVYTLEGDTLTLETDIFGVGSENLTFTRVAE